MGAGCDGPQRLGRSYSIEEFFVAPRPTDSESVIYYPLSESATEDGLGSMELQQPRFGLQVHLESQFMPVEGSPPMPPVRHIRTVHSVPKITLKGASSDVAVRVVMGECAGVAAPPPLSKGLTMLDIDIRPGEAVEVPVDCRRGVMVYILEGVALFDALPNTETSYENEGHVVWYPSARDIHAGETLPLKVRTHTWSKARFVVFVDNN